VTQTRDDVPTNRALEPAYIGSTVADVAGERAASQLTSFTNWRLLDASEP
jgi:hypothetical protein